MLTFTAFADSLGKLFFQGDLAFQVLVLISVQSSGQGTMQPLMWILAETEAMNYRAPDCNQGNVSQGWSKAKYTFEK